MVRKGSWVVIRWLADGRWADPPMGSSRRGWCVARERGQIAFTLSSRVEKRLPSRPLHLKFEDSTRGSVRIPSQGFIR
jgi:hypothetical protein